MNDVKRLQKIITNYTQDYNDVTGDRLPNASGFELFLIDKIHTDDRSKADTQSRRMRDGGSGDGGIDGWHFAEDSKTSVSVPSKVQRPRRRSQSTGHRFGAAREHSDTTH